MGGLVRKMRHQGPDTGEIVGSGRSIKVGPAVFLACEHVIKAPAMPWMLVMHASEDLKLVHSLR